MEHISNLGLVHRDLAARNVLVSESMTRPGEKVLKISDFGMCRTGGEYYQTTGRKMPVKWMAPEAFPAAARKVTTRSDVWSFGVVLSEMATVGEVQPYDEVEQFKEFNAKSAYDLLCRGYRLQKPHNCSHALYATMMDCWLIKPHVRRTFTVLKRQLEDLLEMDHYTRVVPGSGMIYY